MAKNKRPMAKFGNTWWGLQWLNALSHIDYSNRLPRGRSYARNGSVRNIQIEKNTIYADVQGTRKQPYKVNVSVPEFAQAEKDNLLKAIMDSPVVLSQLLNRELPRQLHTLAEEKQIFIFPASWHELQMNCSCPDWAVPCKHLAAVIYMIADEIDRNPFLIFQLHGMDIMQELEKTGFSSGRGGQQIPQTTDIWERPSNATENQEIDKQSGEPDFSVIKHLKADLLHLLASRPLFADRDFKAVLKKTYTKIAGESKNYIQAIGEAELSYSDFFENYEQFRSTTLYLSTDLACENIVLQSATQEKHFQDSQGLERFIAYLNGIPGKYTNMLSPSLKAFVRIYQFILKLLEQSACIPQIVACTTGRYAIRWIPARLNEEVQAVYNTLSAQTPEQMVVVTDTSGKLHSLDKAKQVETIASVFLDFFISTFLKASKRPSDPAETPIEKFFFHQKRLAFTSPGEKEIPETINQWLSPFYITHNTYVPLIKVEPREANNFALSLAVDNRKDSKQEPIPLSSFMQESEFKAHRIGILKALARLTEYFPDIEHILNQSGDMEMEYDGEAFGEILLHIIPAVRLLGIPILLPNALKHLTRPKRTLHLQQNENTAAPETMNSLNQMLEFQWQVAIGDQFVNPDEFKQMVQGLSGVVKIKDRYVLVEQQEMEKLLKNLDDAPQVSAKDKLKAALTEQWDTAPVHIADDVRATIRQLLHTGDVEIPENLEATLRPYQIRGYQWLYRNLQIGFGSIIADDMGLGKTLQVIATLMAMKNTGLLNKQKALAVVPTTLLTNWEKEIEKFAPSLKSHIYHGPSRTFKTDDADVLLTTYGVVRSDIEKLQRTRWAMLIIDEAQNIKNPGTHQTKAVKKLKAPAKIAMSGTPVENRLSEYWSIFDFTNKGYLGSLQSFIKNVARPIEKDRDQELLSTFRQMTAPFIMRRLKTNKQIIEDLPDKVENDKSVDLMPEQAALYQSVVDNMLEVVKEAEEQDKEEQSPINRMGAVLKMMTALKQVCNHPAHYLKKGEIAPKQSGKALLLLDILETIYESNEKVLIFTQYKEMGEMLKQMIESHFHNDVLFLHGGVSRKNRDHLVESFQNDAHHKTFILSIKAGGTGLNLTAANHVVHYDLWWNPAVENQATDRAFRIGQHKNVMVYRLISRGTFEEKINEMLQSKKELANLSVNQGEKWLGELSDKELKEIIAPEKSMV